MKDNGVDLLGMSHKLLCQLLILRIEEDHLLVHATGHDAIVIFLVDVHAENAWSCRLVNFEFTCALKSLDVSHRGQAWEFTLLARAGEALRNVGHALNELGRQTSLALVSFLRLAWCQRLHIR